MTGTLFALALLIVALGALSVPAALRRPPPDVLLLGDSFAVGLARPLRAELEARGVPRSLAIAREGDTLHAFLSRPTKPHLEPWDVVFVSFGTNDFAAGAGSAARARFREHAADLMHEADLGQTELVWILPPNLPALPGCYEWLAHELEAARRDSGTHALTIVSVGRSVVTPGPDGIHPDGRGYQRWAALLAERFRP